MPVDAVVAPACLPPAVAPVARVRLNMFATRTSRALFDSK